MIDWDGMEVLSRLARASVLAVASLVTSLSAAIAALWTLGLTLPPSDEAYGMSLAETLSDPFVVAATVMYALGGASVGFLIALGCLWRTDLSRSIPVVFAVTVGTAALSGCLSGLAVLPTLLAGTAAMLWCSDRFPRKALARSSGLIGRTPV